MAFTFTKAHAKSIDANGSSKNEPTNETEAAAGAAEAVAPDRGGVGQVGHDASNLLY